MRLPELFVYKLRATPKDSLYLFLLLGIEILIEKYPPTASLSGYSNVAILYCSFLASPRQIMEIAFLECTQDIEKPLESGNIQKAIFMQKAIQMIIQKIKFKKTLEDALTCIRV